MLEFKIIDDEYASKVADFVTAYKDELYAIYMKIASDIAFGNTNLKNTLLGYDFILLLQILTIIYVEVKESETICGPSVEMEDLYVSHNIEAIREAFNCKGYDIAELLAVFDVFGGTTKGIGFSMIQTKPSGCTTKNVFQVK